MMGGTEAHIGRIYMALDTDIDENTTWKQLNND
jgi:hypothetical protein